MTLRMLAAVVTIIALLGIGANTMGVRAYTGASVVRVPSGFIAGSITTGEYHSCGIKTGGTVFCWGDDQARAGEWHTQHYVSLLLIGLATGRRERLLKSARVANHTCGVRTDGTIFCWGYDYHGEVDGVPNTMSPYYSSGSPPGGGTFTQVSCRWRAHMWAEDRWNDLLLGTRQCSDRWMVCPPLRLPTTQRDPLREAGRLLKSVRAWITHVAVKTDGTIFCWGYRRVRPGGWQAKHDIALLLIRLPSRWWRIYPSECRR